MRMLRAVYGHLLGALRRVRSRDSEDVLLTVKPTDQRRLPRELDVAHAFAFFLHDQLAKVVIDLEAVGALSVQFALGPEEQAELEGLSGEDLWEWLQTSGRQEVIDDLTYRQLTAAVVSDATHFICESLISCAKGKTTVALALLRKPLKESLLLLEWLAVDPDGFLDRFHGESIRPYTLNRLTETERRGILARAAKLADVPGIDEEFLWTTRFAKEYPNSLETLWTQATHLVTSVKASATEPGNLNFIFSGPSAIEEQWEHYYRIVPLILTYYLAIAENVASRFVERDEELIGTRDLFQTLGLFRYFETTPGLQHLGEEADATFRDLALASFECATCHAPVSVTREDVDRFWLNAEMLCTRCGKRFDVWELLHPSEDSVGG